MIFISFTYKLVCYKSCKCPRGVRVCLKGERRGRNKKKNSRLQEEEKKGGRSVTTVCSAGGSSRVEPGQAGFVGLVGRLVG